MSKRFSTKKVLLSIGALGSAAAIAGLGTFATFTSTTNSSQTSTSGKVVIDLASSGAANRFSVSSGTLVPGDTVQRVVDLTSTSTLGDLGVVTLTSVATTSSVLDTDASAGLQMLINNCSVAWTEAGVSPAYTYTCGGTSSVVRASVPVIGSALALSNLSVIGSAPDTTDHLLFTLTLPGTTGNTFQDKTSTIQYTFDATQRTATNR